MLREDIVADIDMPPFDKAAMDGYACRTCDLGNIMEVVERILRVLYLLARLAPISVLES